MVIGQCFAELNEDLRAIDAFEQAMELDPTAGHAKLKVASCYVNDGKISQAVSAISDWLQQDSRFDGIKYEPDIYSDGSRVDETLQRLLSAHALGGDAETIGLVMHPCAVVAGTATVFLSHWSLVCV